MYRNVRLEGSKYYLTKVDTSYEKNNLHAITFTVACKVEIHFKEIYQTYINASTQKASLCIHPA